MELKQLSYFLRAAEYLNFSRAAESLYISQPSLSYQIAELEKELGAELFLRDRRKVSLTAAGKALLEPARAMVDQATALPDLIRTREDTGLLRIGFDDTEDHFECIGVTEAIARFAAGRPGLQLEMLRAPFTECADRVLYGELDVAFLILRHREQLPPDLTSRPVYRNRLIMAVQESSPVQTCREAVESMELLLVEEKPRGSSRILKALEHMHLVPKIHRVDSLTAGFVYAQMGRGIMLLSEVYFQQHRYPGLRAIPIPDEAAVISHEAVWNRSTANPLVAALLKEFPEDIQNHEP